MSSRDNKVLEKVVAITKKRPASFRANSIDLKAIAVIRRDNRSASYTVEELRGLTG